MIPDHKIDSESGTQIVILMQQKINASIQLSDQKFESESGTQIVILLQ
jgi:hypothetical protein